MSTTADAATRPHDEEPVVTREHDAPRELVVQEWKDCDRLNRRRAPPMCPTVPLRHARPPAFETLITVECAETDGRTRLTVRIALRDTVEEREGVRVVWDRMSDRPGTYLEEVKADAVRA